MLEVLPVRLLTEEDALIFGSLSIALGKLSRLGFPVAPGIVVTPPHLNLKTALEHFDFGKKEVFQQSLTLVKKEMTKIPIPEVLIRETGKQKLFLLDGQRKKGVKLLWPALLDYWLDQVKVRLWNNGFYQGITDNLDVKVVNFIKSPEAFLSSYEDSFQDDVIINTKSGQVHPMDLRKIVELTKLANKKLFITNEYEWVVDRGVKLVGIKQYTPEFNSGQVRITQDINRITENKGKSAVKVFFDLSQSLTIEKDVDGVFIASEKIFDLNKPHESFDKLVFQLVESAVTFPNSPVFLKLADKSEGMGKVRGTLRLLHQKSLLSPLMEALDFARLKKGLTNVHIVIPFVRGVNELLQIKRELAVKKLMRKNSLQIWMEAAVPENIINMEDYLVAGIDGVVLNLDELIAHLNGFDPLEGSLAFYKNEIAGMLKFLEDGIRLLHKAKVPFIANGSLVFDSRILEFLVEKGVYGLVVEGFEAHSAHDLLYQVEKRMVLRKTV